MKTAEQMTDAEKQVIICLARKIVQLEEKSKLDTLKTEIETRVDALIKKHQLDMYGDPLEADIFSIETVNQDNVRVVFNDENVGYLIAGYVACSIHDELEQILRDLGYDIYDSDGSAMYLETVG